MYDTDRDSAPQLVRLLGVLNTRRAALEQQREDIEAVLAEVVTYERQCRELLSLAGVADIDLPPETRTPISPAE